MSPKVMTAPPSVNGSLPPDVTLLASCGLETPSAVHAVARRCLRSLREQLDAHSAPADTRVRLGLEAVRRLTAAGADGPRQLVEAELGPLTTGRRPHLIRLSDVVPEQVTWRWNPYLPAGKLTLLEGDPGMGKTFVALTIAAIESRGWAYPDVGAGSAVRPAGQVIFVTAEDGLADTIAPRLEAADADRSRIHVLQGELLTDPATGEEKQRDGFTLADLGLLEAAVEEVQPTLVVLDPLVAFLGDGVDAHRDAEVRQVLGPLARLSEKYSCAVLGIRHLTKGTAGRAIYRGGGSIAFTAAARSVLLAGPDPDDRVRGRAIAHIKSNLTPAGRSLGYIIDNGRLAWTGVSSLEAQDLLAPEDEAETGAREEARAFVREIVSDGAIAAEVVRQRARKAEISLRTLERAKKDLGIRSRQEGKRWVWLPLDTPPEIPDDLFTPGGDS